ncbi:carboxypeptidase-like regulatory domain-containing protein [Streptomyces sp. NBC_01549]|uniref:carboxypeptidase-like regulatory domain-containing protein n=1 Tax=unclassified Streptomyces TaxID=2593676 RepID=UPI002254F910|nr:carboxypeptidase-like regulatory domain-containing protein [Streptomyces sp. NBC_01549]MCX4597659.1 carboxypeptidase-like regulatory domain-containing protein [Streptomyces sp. NBC_01549]
MHERKGGRNQGEGRDDGRGRPYSHFAEADPVCRSSTPDGLAAFRDRAHGVVSGTVTDAAKGAPIAGATVSAGRTTGHTDAKGAYRLVLPAGSYDFQATAFGHQAAAATGIKVTDGGSVHQDFALTTVATENVSGKVTDGSGHDWPLYAEITIDGVPGGRLWTDPVTGAYNVDLPQGSDYTFHVTSAYPGYLPATASAQVAKTAVTKNIPLSADSWNITAPGYAPQLTGATQGFDAPSTPPGWSVDNAEGTTGG